MLFEEQIRLYVLPSLAEELSELFLDDLRKVLAKLLCYTIEPTGPPQNYQTGG